MSPPLVSVIVPAYNAEAYIGKAIDSVLRQTLRDLEIIIINDNSQDGTKEIIETFAARDRRVRHFSSGTRNLGPGGARNAAIAMAAGEWVAVLDADDWYEASRLERLINAARLLDLPVAADNQRFIDDDKGHWRHLLVSVQPGEPPLRCLDADDLLKGDRLHRKARNLGLLKPVIRRDFLEAHDIRYDADTKVALGEDFYFLLKCLRYSPYMVFVSEAMYNYRIYHPLAYTKRQPMAAFEAVVAMHARYKVLFNPDDSPSTARLMQKRDMEIKRFVRLKHFVEPLKKGEAGIFCRQVLRDPGGFVLLLARGLRDPSGIFLLLRYLTLHAYFRISDTLVRLNKPGQHDS